VPPLTVRRQPSGHQGFFPKAQLFGFTGTPIFYQGLFSEINLNWDKLGRKYEERNAKLCSIISEIARGMALFSTDTDTLGDAYVEQSYFIGRHGGRWFLTLPEGD
jgi:hypothetical protein